MCVCAYHVYMFLYIYIYIIICVCHLYEGTSQVRAMQLNAVNSRLRCFCTYMKQLYCDCTCIHMYIHIYIYIYIIICIYIYIFINVILSIYLGSRYTFYSMLYMVVRYPDVCWLRLLRGTGRPSNLCWRGTWAPWEGRSWPKPGPTQEFSANEAGKCNSSPDPKIWPNYNISPT